LFDIVPVDDISFTLFEFNTLGVLPDVVVRYGVVLGKGIQVDAVVVISNVVEGDGIMR
jgi:hypothetical protein